LKNGIAILMIYMQQTGHVALAGKTAEHSFCLDFFTQPPIPVANFYQEKKALMYNSKINLAA
jgi:hypothetical protein